MPWNHPCPTRLSCRTDPCSCRSSTQHGILRPALRAGPLRAELRAHGTGGTCRLRARCYVPALSEPPRLPALLARVCSPTVRRDRVGHGCFWGTASRDFLSARSRGALGGPGSLAATVWARYRPGGVVISFRARTPSLCRSLRKGTCPPLRPVFTLRAHLSIPLNALG